MEPNSNQPNERPIKVPTLEELAERLFNAVMTAKNAPDPNKHPNAIAGDDSQSVKECPPSDGFNE